MMADAAEDARLARAVGKRLTRAGTDGHVRRVRNVLRSRRFTARFRVALARADKPITDAEGVRTLVLHVLADDFGCAPTDVLLTIEWSPFTRQLGINVHPSIPAVAAAVAADRRERVGD
jgi:hypothetical protein